MAKGLIVWKKDRHASRDGYESVIKNKSGCEQIQAWYAQRGNGKWCGQVLLPDADDTYTILAVEGGIETDTEEAMKMAVELLIN